MNGGHRVPQGGHGYETRRRATGCHELSMLFLAVRESSILRGAAVQWFWTWECSRELSGNHGCVCVCLFDISSLALNFQILWFCIVLRRSLATGRPGCPRKPKVIWAELHHSLFASALLTSREHLLSHVSGGLSGLSLAGMLGGAV